jgi:hypothetical protein
MEAAMEQAREMASTQGESFAQAVGSLESFVGQGPSGIQMVPAQGGNPAYVQLPPREEPAAEPEPSPEPEPQAPGASHVSSFDLEVMELAEQIDVGELLLNGYAMAELEIVPGYLSVSVRSLKRSDMVEVRKDIDEYRRGKPVDPSKPEGDWITPFPDAVMDFANLRQLAAGVLGINGQPLPADWMQRAAEIEDRPDGAYEAIKREYRKFLAAVNLLFPDKPTKEVFDKLRERLGKAPAHP